MPSSSPESPTTTAAHEEGESVKSWDVWGRKPRPCKVCEARRARPAETEERGVA